VVTNADVVFSGTLLGMDYCESDENLAISDNATSTIRGIVPGSGAEAWSINIPYSGIYGVCQTGASTMHILDYALGWLGGVALFPYRDDLGIVVTYYDFYYFAFYSFNGSELTFLGEGHIEAHDFTDSYGISYNPSSDTFFWTYEIYGGENKITEFDYEFQTTSLNRDTWAGIKISFKEL